MNTPLRNFCSSAMQFALLVCLPALVFGEEWSKGMVVAEKSASPDGRFGILVKDFFVSPASSGIPAGGRNNFLADVPEAKILGAVKAASYVQNEGRTFLKADWTADSRFCLVEYLTPLGFGTVVVLAPDKSELKQFEIGGYIKKRLDAICAKQEREKKTKDPGNAVPYSSQGCSTKIFSRITTDGKIRVHAFGGDSAKCDDKANTFLAGFSGTFDILTGKWRKARAYTLQENDIADLNVLFNGIVKDDETTTDESRAVRLNGQLTLLADALKRQLPQKEKALELEDDVWAKTRNGSPDVASKNQLTRERIQALHDMFWASF